MLINSTTGQIQESADSGTSADTSGVEVERFVEDQRGRRRRQRGRHQQRADQVHHGKAFDRHDKVQNFTNLFVRQKYSKARLFFIFKMA